MDSQYWTVTVKFKRVVKRYGRDEIDNSERQSELWAASGKDAIKMYQPIFYENEPQIVVGTEKFTVKAGRHIK